MQPEDFLEELKGRLQNAAVPDSALIKTYIIPAMRNVRPQNYLRDDYIEQVLDTACYKLAMDGKFPRVTSITQNGLSTAFDHGDPEAYKEAIKRRRAAMLIGSGAGLGGPA